MIARAARVHPELPQVHTIFCPQACRQITSEQATACGPRVYLACCRTSRKAADVKSLPAVVQKLCSGAVAHRWKVRQHRLTRSKQTQKHVACEMSLPHAATHNLCSRSSRWA